MILNIADGPGFEFIESCGCGQARRTKVSISLQHIQNPHRIFEEEVGEDDPQRAWL